MDLVDSRQDLPARETSRIDVTDMSSADSARIIKGVSIGIRETRNVRCMVFIFGSVGLGSRMTGFALIATRVPNRQMQRFSLRFKDS